MIVNRSMIVSFFLEIVVTKPQRDTDSQSRLRGYNHNFKYRGKMFHIQTENYGHPRCYICSHVFISGQVVKRIKTEYPKTTDELQSLAHLKGLMLAAHRQMFQLLKAGAFDEHIEEGLGKSDAPPATQNSPTFANSDIEKLDKQLKTAAEAFKDSPAVARPVDVPPPAANGPATAPTRLNTKARNTVPLVPGPKKGPSPAIPRPTPAPPAKKKPEPALKVVSKSNAVKLKPLALTPKKMVATPAAPVPAAPAPKQARSSVPLKAAPTQSKPSALSPPESAKPKTKPKPAPASAPTLSADSQASLTEFTNATSGIVTLALFDASQKSGQLRFASGRSANIGRPALEGLVKLRQSDRNPKDPTDHMVEMVTKTEHHLMLLCRVNEGSSLFLMIERSGGNLALVQHRVSKLIAKLQQDLTKA